MDKSSNPFIVPDSPESTYIQINNVLAFLAENIQQNIEGGLYRCERVTYPTGPDHLYGEQLILFGLQEAVTWLGEQAMEPKLKEVKA